jgi:glycine/D-amino acid oxidase-like deaminating enzyme
MDTLQLPDDEVSYWTHDADTLSYPSLQEEITVDVAVIGAGIAGLSAAYFLKQAGLTVAVLESGTIGAKVTGHTTGKVTSQHNLCYAELEKRFGHETARLYGEANQTAITEMEKIVKKENIACDWQRNDNYVFTEKLEEVSRLQNEANVASQLGLHATFETSSSLPFAIKGAVRFADQAKFHVRRYLLGLAQAVHGQGSYVLEHTKAGAPSDSSPCVIAAGRGKLVAKHVIIATNVPFPLAAHSYYGAYEYPLKSYIVASKIADKNAFDGMYITPSGGPLRSILAIKTGNETMLLIGGESHFPGFGVARGRHQRLADYAAEKFGLTSIDYRWSTWDYLSNDGVPLIGKLYPWSKQVYVATGFMKWGLTTGTVAGMILRDTILGQPNPWAKVYDSTRLSPVTSLPRAMSKILKNL